MQQIETQTGDHSFIQAQQQMQQQARSRSMSESQRSTRAEKRMGRLFRQQSSSVSHSKSTSDQSNQSNQYLNQNDNETGNETDHRDPNSNILESEIANHSELKSQFDTNVASPNLNEINNKTSNKINSNYIDDLISPHDSNHDTPFVHSNSSSISSQIGSSTSSSTTPSITSNQVTRKFTIGSSSSVAAATEVISPNFYIPNNSESIITNQEENSKFSKHRENFSKLSTLPENELDDHNNDHKSLESLLFMSKKFIKFHYQFLLTLKTLDINLSLSMTNFNVLLSVLDNVEKNFNQKDQDEISTSMKAHLTLSLINSMTDLKKFIENLKLYFKSNEKNIRVDSLRMTYFTLFSLFIELTNICKIVVPFTSKSSSSSSSLSSTNNNNLIRNQQLVPLSSSTSSSVSVSISGTTSTVPTIASNANSTEISSQNNNMPIQKSKSLFAINRTPAPNSQVSLQNITTRQQTISRQTSKLDRQDSELSNSSNQSTDYNSTANSSMNTTIDDDKLFDLILHTIQAAQLVYGQINSAIAKSAAIIAENNNGNDDTDNSSSNGELNSIASKVKELTNQCLISMERTKKVKNCLNMVKNPNSCSLSDDDLHKNIFEQTNLFLKSIINILAATKSAIDDIPTLNEVRSSLSILTRATKELTIKLESSTLKQVVLNNTPSTTTLVDQPQLSSIPSMGNFLQDQQSLSFIPTSTPTSSSHQPIMSPPPQQQVETTSIRRANKLRQIPEHERSIGVMKQHIMNLELNSAKVATEPLNQAPLTVTTPLIASIGPSVASAVLPIKSPLKTNSALNSNVNLSATFIPTNSNMDFNLNNNTNTSTTPSYLGDDGNNNNNTNNMHNEYNPFDRLIPRS